MAASAATQPTLGDLVRQGKRVNVLAAITSPDVDVNEKAPDGSTALMWASHNDDLELVQALLKRGARADVTNNFGATALAEAIKLGDMDLFTTLLDGGADIESPNLDNQTALMLAISLNQVEMAKELIKRGADVKAMETFRDQTALMWAAGAGQPEVVDLLLDGGAASQVNLRASFDDWERQQTSEPRAQYASRQTGGLTALLFATRSGCLRCAQSLVEAGADVNKPNPDGVTPLINALDGGKFDVAMYLLDQGANPHVWDMHGRTAIYVAVDRNTGGGGGGGRGGRGGGNPGAAPGAIGGADGPGTPGRVGGFGSPGGAQRGPAVRAMDVINRLIDMGVDVNHQLTQKRPYGPGRGRFQDYDMRDGVGPLFLAVLQDDRDAAEVLLQHGAEVDLRNVFKMTPLMIATGMRATAGRGGGVISDATRAIRMVDLLLDAGADINAQIIGSRTHSGTILAYVAGRDQEGKTALMSAAESGSTAVVEHLLERGADPMIEDAEGKTALHFARTPPPPSRGAAAAAAGEAPDEGTGARGTGGPRGGGREALAQLLETAMAQASGR